MSEFFTSQGVDLPRAWSMYCRRAPMWTFERFLRSEFPAEYAAWRILK